MTKYRIVELNNGQFVVQEERYITYFRRPRGGPQSEWVDVKTYKHLEDAQDRKAWLEGLLTVEAERRAAEAHAKGIKRIVE